ncbi:MAG TPA: alpha-amylase family glycosyl hydrolase, partial [Steroidobacteraceae bacterium]|nr:alpha-amylase family glycosyl hydrolase [Steroidobacteraceae bacterium]
AIWLGPIFRNRPVQGPRGHESAGYHGYWITDFTAVDPHFGTAAEMQALVDAVHARGMKLYLDIVVNHTADVIRYRECPDNDCPYRPLADYPYTRRGGVSGEPINAGFAGHAAENQTAANFARLTRPDFAYTPFIPAGEEHLKVPDWLNDPIYYHNRGNSTFAGESSTLGDFGGLDDVMTENPRVVQGFIDIYSDWIDRFGIDGFRIDTARHVNPEFWQAFVPAIRSHAAAAGIPNFHIFGEVSTNEADVALLAEHTRVDRLPAVLDFAFHNAVRDCVAGNAGTDLLARVFAGDALYEGGADAALQLPTFVSNHDDGRFAMFVQRLRPGASDAETLQRTRLAQAMLLTLRGVPVIYYGDEQGFVGRGADQAARQDMFASQVASYNEQPLLGTSATTATDSYRPTHPLYRLIARLADLRLANPALRHGRQVVRAAGPAPGLFAVSRFDPRDGHEVLVAFNTSTNPLDAAVLVNAASARFSSLYGQCTAAAEAPGSYRVHLAPLDFVVCAAAAPD